MILNLNLQRKHSIKKILILILFAFVCFFIKENVFAEPLDHLHEAYNNTMMTSCTDLSDNGVCSVLDSEDSPITERTFRDVLYMLYPLNSYFIDMTNYYYYDDENPTEYHYIYLFDTKPKLAYNSLKNWFSDQYTGEIEYYYYNYYYFTYSANTKLSCYIFEYTEPGTNAYGTMKMYYSKDCLNNDEQKYDYSDIRPFERFDHCDSTYSNCKTLVNFVNKVSNFDLYDLNDNLIYSSNVKDNIIVPEETINQGSKTIWETIKDIFNSIVSLPSKIINGITDGIKYLFVPGEELEGFFEEEYEYIKKQLGFLTYPIEIVVEFADRFYEIDNTNSAVFKIPKLEIFDKTIYEGTEFDLMSLVNKNENIKYLYSIYKIAVSGFIVLWLVQLAIKKEHEIFGGGTE